MSAVPTSQAPKLRVYELRNPHDPYTFVADDRRVAQCVGLLVGSGFYPVLGPRREPVLPFLGLKNLDTYKKRTFGDFDKFTRKNAAAIYAALVSFIIGDRGDRKQVLAKYAQVFLNASIPAVEAFDYVREYHDSRRAGALDLRKLAQGKAAQIWQTYLSKTPEKMAAYPYMAK